MSRVSEVQEQHMFTEEKTPSPSPLRPVGHKTFAGKPPAGARRWGQTSPPKANPAATAASSQAENHKSGGSRSRD